MATIAESLDSILVGVSRLQAIPTDVLRDAGVADLIAQVDLDLWAVIEDVEENEADVDESPEMVDLFFKNLSGGGS